MAKRKGFMVKGVSEGKKTKKHTGRKRRSGKRSAKK